jgi:hypothetical protein
MGMACDPVDFGDFCREWEIFDRGDHDWSDMIEERARFIIVRSKNHFRFIPSGGMKGRMRPRPLMEHRDQGCGGYEDGIPLAGALMGTFNGKDIWFTLNRVDDDLVISLSDDAPGCPVPGQARLVAHGGPHGRDN